jgi:hypothetical protein
MAIAVLGWGSLIWKPGGLSTTGRWRPGPDLPVEFARRSNDGRVTLVLYGDHRSPTYWVESRKLSVDAVCADLWEREGRTKFGSIHFTTGEGLRTWRDASAEGGSLDVSGLVEAWLESTPRVAAAVWTGLPPRGFDREDASVSDQVVDHLRDLDEPVKALAKEYVQKAPASIRTLVRAAIEDSLGWMPIDLSPELFEPNPMA